MVKKSLLKKIFNRKKSVKVDSNSPSKPSKLKQLFRKNKSLLSELLKKVFASEKFKEFQKFFIFIFGYGLIINYSLCFIFGFVFSFFTIFAWGIAYYFINQEFVEWIRRIIAKR